METGAKMFPGSFRLVVAKKTIDYVKVKELFDNNMRVVDIASFLGVSKGTISKV